MGWREVKKRAVVALSGDAAKFSAAPTNLTPVPVGNGLHINPLPFTWQYLAMNSNPIHLIAFLQSMYENENSFCCRGHMDRYRRAFIDHVEYTGQRFEKTAYLDRPTKASDIQGADCYQSTIIVQKRGQLGSINAMRCVYFCYGFVMCRKKTQISLCTTIRTLG